MEQLPKTEFKIYDIAGTQYRLEPASFEQHAWLAQGPLAGIDFGTGLREADLEGVIQQHGPELLGIVLIAEGQTREQKAEAGRDAARKLGTCFARQMTPAEVRALAHDFFLIDGYQNLAFFINFQALEARTIAEKTAATAMPSSPVSASSPTATLPHENPLPVDGVLVMPNSH